MENTYETYATYEICKHTNGYLIHRFVQRSEVLTDDCRKGVAFWQVKA